MKPPTGGAPPLDCRSYTDGSFSEETQKGKADFFVDSHLWWALVRRSLVSGSNLAFRRHRRVWHQRRCFIWGKMADLLWISETSAQLCCCYWLCAECEKNQARLSFVFKNAKPPSRPLLLLTGLNLPDGNKPTFHWQTYAPQERNLFRSHNFDIKGHPRCERAVISHSRGDTIEHNSSQWFRSFLYLLAALLRPQSIQRDQNWQRWIMGVMEDVMETLTHHNLSP